jgi:hypothetical protein
MKPVDQTIIDKDRGDCMRACIASMLELDLSQVPNFLAFGRLWYNMMWAFLGVLGWELHYTDFKNKPTENDTINGAIMASVKSLTIEGSTHSVLIDINGNVIHDPNPNKLYSDKTVLNEMVGFFKITKKDTPLHKDRKRK